MENPVIKDVLIERQMMGLKFNNPVPVTYGFQLDVKHMLGEAILRKEKDGIYADITLMKDISPTIAVGRYPAIGGTCTMIHCVSFVQENEDPLIPKIQQKQIKDASIQEIPGTLPTKNQGSQAQ